MSYFNYYQQLNKQTTSIANEGFIDDVKHWFGKQIGKRHEKDSHAYTIKCDKTFKEGNKVTIVAKNNYLSAYLPLFKDNDPLAFTDGILKVAKELVPIVEKTVKTLDQFGSKMKPVVKYIEKELKNGTDTTDILDEVEFQAGQIAKEYGLKEKVKEIGNVVSKLGVYEGIKTNKQDYVVTLKSEEYYKEKIELLKSAQPIFEKLGKLAADYELYSPLSAWFSDIVEYAEEFGDGDELPNTIESEVPGIYELNWISYVVSKFDIKNKECDYGDYIKTIGLGHLL